MATPRIGREVFEKTMSEPKNEPTKESLTPAEAGEFLFEFLPDDAQELIREASNHMGFPIWQMLLGYVMRCYDGALTFSPFILASWENGGRPNKSRPCRSCGEMFFSRFPDAQFCCERCSFGKLTEFGHNEACQVRIRG